MLICSSRDFGPSGDRNMLPALPTRDGAMGFVPELTGHPPDASEALDDLLMGFHTAHVCHDHTAASIEDMRLLRQNKRMDRGDSIGTRLRMLKERSGMSLQDIADAVKMKRPTVQRYFTDEYRPRGHLPLDLAIKLAGALTGKGAPPIAREEILDLTGLPQVATSEAGPDPLPYEMSEAMAETAAKVALRGQEPEPDVVEAISKILTSLFQLYASDPSARHDVGLTRGALKVLYQQFGPRGRG